jgi:ferritin-like protein
MSNPDGLHEPAESLSAETKDFHRAIRSLIEELEAVDWYHQRAEACSDDALRAVLVHNRNEEIEHALMALEWVRRRDPVFDEAAKTYLFSEGPITEVEEAATGKASAPETGEKGPPGSPPGALGIGSLKGK